MLQISISAWFILCYWLSDFRALCSFISTKSLVCLSTCKQAIMCVCFESSRNYWPWAWLPLSSLRAKERKDRSWLGSLVWTEQHNSSESYGTTLQEINCKFSPMYISMLMIFINASWYLLNCCTPSMLKRPVPNQWNHTDRWIDALQCYACAQTHTVSMSTCT